MLSIKNTKSELRADFALVRHLTDCFAVTTWPFPSLLLGWLTDFFLDGLARLDLLAALLGLLQLAPRPLDLDTLGGGREDDLDVVFRVLVVFGLFFLILLNLFFLFSALTRTHASIHLFAFLHWDILAGSEEKNKQNGN